MYTSAPVWKQIAVSAIRRIKDDAIVKDLHKFSTYQMCVHVDTMHLSELLDRPLKEWMTDNILAP